MECSDSCSIHSISVLRYQEGISGSFHVVGQSPFNRAPYGFRLSGNDCLPCQCLLHGKRQIGTFRLGTVLAERIIQIVHSTAIDQFTFGTHQHGLGRVSSSYRLRPAQCALRQRPAHTITLSKCCNFGFCNRWIRKPAHHFYFTWILPLPLLIERVQVKCIILTNWAKWSQKDPDFPHINLELESCDCARAPLRWSSGRNRCPHSMKAMQIAAHDVPLTCAFEA